MPVPTFFRTALVATVAFSASSLLTLGTAAQDATPMATPGAAHDVPLTNAAGKAVGLATFTEDADGVHLQLSVEGLEPGEHGWHLHAMGICDPSGLEPFSTAGPHWNPTGELHGAPEADPHHAGDFGNLTATDDGLAETEITTTDYTLGDGPTSVNDADGTAIIIHVGTDDLTSQPSGNSGARYACGVVAEPQEKAVAPDKDASVDGNIVAPTKMPFTEELLNQLQVPEGFKISVFAQGLDHPRMLAVGPTGDTYVTETEANTVRILRDTDADGVADAAEPVATNLKLVHGITFLDSQVYLAGETSIWVADVADDGTFGEPKEIVSDLPDGDQHPRRTIAVGPDGMLYVSVGSSCNACIESNPENATILQMNLDGSDRKTFASGLRNTIGWGWEPETGALWGMDQGSDWRGDEQPPEELNQITEGGNYGWPFCFGDRQVDAYLSQMPPGATPEQYCANTVAPTLEYDAHSAAIWMTFYTGSQFPAEYQGDAFVAMHGSWNRAEPNGYKVVRVTFENGQPTGFEDFASGWLIEDGAAHFGRVAGLAVTPDGTLLISDDANGIVYRVAANG